jgi:hypothetical protein
LRDRSNVHAGLAERTEEFGGDAGISRHTVADDGEDAASARDLHSLNLSVMPLGKESAFHCGPRTVGGCLRHGETDRVL